MPAAGNAGSGRRERDAGRSCRWTCICNHGERQHRLIRVAPVKAFDARERLPCFRKISAGQRTRNVYPRDSSTSNRMKTNRLVAKTKFLRKLGLLLAIALVAGLVWKPASANCAQVRIVIRATVRLVEDPFNLL